MNKRLTARVQKLSRRLPQEALSFSTALVIEPDDNEVLEKRGTLYTVFDISGGITLDPLLVTKIVHDVLHDSYYSSDLVSPIQSLERAIVQVKDKVTDLPDVDTNIALDFNILAAVLWGNVLYIVQFGKGGSFLVREGEVKPVSSATEGNFSEASGVVRGDDVVILGTQQFISKYSPEELVSGAFSFSVSDMSEKSSALLMKFESVADLTEDEAIDFSEGKKVARPIIKKPSLKSTLSIAKKVPPTLPKIAVKSVGKRSIKPMYTVIGVVVLLLGISIFFTLNKRDSEEASMDQESGEVVGDKPLIDEERDVELKITRVDPEVFYDVKITNESASPKDIAVLDSSVIVSDPDLGKIFSSSTVTPKFTEGSDLFNNIRFISYFGGDLVFVDDEGYKVFSEGMVSESYSQDNLGSTSSYLSFVYSVQGNEIIKYEKGEVSLSGSTWTQSDELNDVVSMAIDGSIYVLKENGSLLRFFSGEKDDFTVSGLDKPFSNPKKVVKDIDFENIYVADSGNGRIVILGEDGALIRQYVANGDSWNDIRSVGVTRDEGTLFVLSGSKVYKLDL